MLYYIYTLYNYLFTIYMNHITLIISCVQKSHATPAAPPHAALDLGLEIRILCVQPQDLRHQASDTT